MALSKITGNPHVRQGQVKCVGVDLGVRAFAICFSDKEALIVGDNFAKEKLFP
jgi:hypothetical protein